MIKKLHNLKNMQLNQKLIQKQELDSQMIEINTQLDEIQISLSQTGVKMFGSISDFKILAIHKNTLKNNREKLTIKKNILQKKINQLDNELIENNKEIEQYKYLLQMEKVKKMKQDLKNEELVASDFVQARWMMR